jgi:DNA-binding response OmpR family regulator
MDYSPLGAVCRELGLMSELDIHKVLERLSQGMDVRFGALALQLGVLDEEGLARALAHQYRLNLLSAEQLEKQRIPPAVLDRVPEHVIRRYHLIPILYEPDHDVLTVLGSDPTDVLALRAVREQAGVSDIRLFLATRGAVAAHIERALGYSELGSDRELPSEPIMAALQGARLQRDLVLETDARRLHALERLDAIEDGTTEFASDPDQVAWLLGASPIRRLVFRTELRGVVAPYLDSWRRIQPGLRVVTVSSYGLRSMPALEPKRISRFHLELLRFLLQVAESRDTDARIQVWRATDLTRAVSQRLGLASEQVETAVLGALFFELETLESFRTLAKALPTPSNTSPRFALARSLMQAFDAPYDLEGLLRALEHRLGGGGPIGAHPGAEVVYTVRHVVRRRQPGQDDLTQILGDNVHHHSPRVVKALGSVLRWATLHSDNAGRDERDDEVLVAVRDPILLAALELELVRSGFGLVLAAHGQDVLQLAATWQPCCVIADIQLPRLGGSQLLAALKQQSSTRELPVVLIGSSGSPASRLIEQGAEDVLAPPVDVGLLVAKLQRLTRRNGDSGPRGVRGQISQLPLTDLIQTLSLGGRTGTVQVSMGERRGSIAVKRGQLRHAALGELQGLPALQVMVRARQGDFSVTFGGETPEPNLRGTTEWLLLEALRVSDEAGQGPAEPDEE